MTATEIMPRNRFQDRLPSAAPATTQSDGERFCALSNSLYARKVDLAYYRWQFFAGPFPSVLSMVFAPNGDLAGCYGFHLRRLAGSDAQISMALEAMIAPEYQAKGLLKQLIEHGSEQFLADNPIGIMGMANARAGRLYKLKMGWTEVTGLQDWTLAAENLPTAVSAELCFVPITTIGAEEDAYLRASSERRGKVGMALARDAALWQWRFLDNPRYRYELFRAEHQEKLVGMLALKLFVDPVTGERFGDIVDIAWREVDAAILPELLTGAASHLHEQGAQQISIWLQTNTELDEAGRKSGFHADKPTTTFGM